MWLNSFRLPQRIVVVPNSCVAFIIVSFEYFMYISGANSFGRIDLGCNPYGSMYPAQITGCRIHKASLNVCNLDNVFS